MTPAEYNAVKKPLQDAEALMQKIYWTENAVVRYTGNNLMHTSMSRKLSEKEAEFTALISKCIKLLIEQRKTNSGELNSLYPCPSYYCAMSAYETLFKNQPKEEKK